MAKAKEILEVVDEEVGNIYKDLKYAEILHFDEKLIVCESGITIEYDDIVNAYMVDELLYLEMGSRLMVYLVE